MIELKNIDVTFYQKKQQIDAVKNVSLTIEKKMYLASLVIQEQVKVPWCA